MQDEEAPWSSVSEHEIVADSHQYIQLEQLERLVAAVRWNIDRVRTQQAHATVE